jgi:hypothetical protein
MFKCSNVTFQNGLPLSVDESGRIWVYIRECERHDGTFMVREGIQKILLDEDEVKTF